MQIHHLHEWDLSPAEAITLQKRLAVQARFDDLLDVNAIHTVAGVDVSVQENISQAAVVILSYPALQVIETVTHRMPTPFPYIPGLLTFREGPVLEQAFLQLQTEPDVFIFDGMGRIHPRQMGIATHMGLWLDRPTVGCGKTMFVGDYVEPPPEAGTSAPLLYHGQQIGAILRTRAKVKPVFISVGHRANLTSAVELILRCTTRYRLPEPIRAAHNAAGKMD